MSQDRVSVVIPTFNRAYCLPIAIGSLQNQTYTDWEAVVVDDGSTDDTAAVVRALTRSDPRVRYHYQQNGGVSAARNTGLNLATGRWIAFLDSDDAWECWKLSAQVACFRHLPEVGMVWTDMTGIDAQGRVVSANHLRKMYRAYRLVGEQNLFSHERDFASIDPQLAGQHAPLAKAKVRSGDLYSSIIFGSLVHTSTVLLARERLEKVGYFEVNYRTGEDYDFHLRTCREGPVALLDTPSVLYRLAGGADQLTAPSYGLQMALNGLRTRENAIARDRARIGLTDRQLSRIMAHANRWVAEEHFRRGDYPSARPYYRRSGLLWSRNLRTLAKAGISHLPRPAASWLARHMQHRPTP